MRQISREKYIIAFFLTLGIFLLGLLLGLVIEGKRAAYIESASKEQNLEFSSLQIQYAFIDQLSQEKNCEAVSKTFEENIENLESTKISKEDFSALKREYTLAQLRYWLLAKRTKELCGNDIVSILYFFSDVNECPDCDKQAFVLTYLKKKFREKLLIFSFDSKLLEEPMISILKSTYGIDKYPTLVIEDKSYWSFKDTDDILGMICKYYKTEVEDCKGYE